MDNAATIQILIALVGIIGSGFAVFVGLKVGLAESKKDITWMTRQMEQLDRRFTVHVEGATHPTSEQIRHLASSVEELKEYVDAALTRTDQKVDNAHNRIEKKVDSVVDILMRNRQTDADYRKS